jgi:hypothetical protein
MAAVSWARSRPGAAAGGGRAPAARRRTRVQPNPSSGPVGAENLCHLGRCSAQRGAVSLSRGFTRACQEVLASGERYRRCRRAKSPAGLCAGPPCARQGWCSARRTGNRRHGFPAIPGRDNRPGGPHPRGTTGDATAAHPPGGPPGIPHAVNGAASPGHSVATAPGLALQEVMSKPGSRRFPVTITHLPVTRCQICHTSIAYQPGKARRSSGSMLLRSEVLVVWVEWRAMGPACAHSSAAGPPGAGAPGGLL